MRTKLLKLTRQNSCYNELCLVLPPNEAKDIHEQLIKSLDLATLNKNPVKIHILIVLFLIGIDIIKSGFFTTYQEITITIQSYAQAVFNNTTVSPQSSSVGGFHSEQIDRILNTPIPEYLKTPILPSPQTSYSNYTSHSSIEMYQSNINNNNNSNIIYESEETNNNNNNNYYNYSSYNNNLISNDQNNYNNNNSNNPYQSYPGFFSSSSSTTKNQTLDSKGKDPGYSRGLEEICTDFNKKYGFRGISFICVKSGFFTNHQEITIIIHDYDQTLNYATVPQQHRQITLQQRQRQQY
ncbi:hypothetical protein PPL_08778 [Heterostelium album PN500]|uniref:Uncharacterized protein n=1 Tax=Heterostelium pallidum (strain ATCC 26659 / Pp 5 / PN500) TaxID=670386 RepID=D3BJP9_HETP5|nr:hypothetical protein PPL_08778 [Heterostelium album PN500]EFA78129.1 hypothetical protein PPL_08778 [Heterostelium album PN500]|eukprot:XP_020430255.1 hypothetical protein PPL_08778 [Heterostelium album PN500]